METENITLEIQDPEPIPEPTQEPVEEPVAEVVEEPVAEVVEEPVAEVVEEPVAEVVEEPLSVPIEEPVNEPIEEPVNEPIEEPVNEPIEEPVPEVVEEPVNESIEEPVPEVVEEPVAEVVEEPVAEDVEEPVSEVVEEPVTEPIEEPVNEPSEEPVPEPVEEPATSDDVTPVIPKIIFIVPYRDREQQQKFFSTHMKMVLEDMSPSEYKIYYIHQVDSREFNRGAMKNIGFLAMKNKYPNDYKNITFVFNDVDTMPFSKNFLNYDTMPGVIKHFYGYKYCLGGIVSIKGGDFENILGYPNFWAWGYEDNLLQKRALDAGLTIDRDQFYPIMDKNIIQMKDGLTRLINRSEFDRYTSETTEGIHSINTLNYEIDEMTGFVNVTTFFTGIEPNTQQNAVFDIRNGTKPYQQPVLPFGNKSRRKPTFGMKLF